MKRQFFASLSTLLTIAAMFPAQSFASTFTMHDSPVEKTGTGFVQKSNRTIPYLRIEKEPEKVKETTLSAIYSSGESSAQEAACPSLEAERNIAEESYGTYPPVDDVNEQKNWLGDTHFPASDNVAVR